MKIGICNETFKDWPIETTFEYAHELGYDGVEIAPFTLADDVRDISAGERRRLRDAAAARGVEIIGLHWLLVRPPGLSINHPDAEIRTRTQAYLKDLIHFCADIGGKVLIHGSPNQRTVQQGWSLDEAWMRARETFEQCAVTAEERGVIYSIEPLTRRETNFINTVEDALRLVAEINHPHFQTMVDCRSSELSEGRATDALAKALASGHLRHVHVNDASGRGPGFGRVAFTPILKTLMDGGYAGYVSVEVFEFDRDPRTIAARSIGYLRGILETLERAP